MKIRVKTIVLGALGLLIAIGFIKDRFLDTPESALARSRTFIDSVASKSVDEALYRTPRILTYKMYFMSLFPVGQLKFTVRPTEEETLFFMDASPRGGIFDGFVDASMRLESTFPWTDGAPGLSTRAAEISKYRKEEKRRETVFDRVELVAIRGDERTRISERTLDPLGAFVKVFSGILSRNTTDTEELLSKQDIYLFKITPREFRGEACFIDVSIRRQNNTSTRGADFKCWISSGPARIPLVFKGWMPIGYASIVLDKVDA